MIYGRAILVAASLIGAANGQLTEVDLRTQSKSVDFSNANTTKPFKSGTVLPATCGVGEAFFQTNALAGLNLYGCTAVNSWTLLSVGTLTGDVTGTAGSSVVSRIEGRAVSASAPSAGQSLAWNSTTNNWTPQTVAGADQNYQASSNGTTAMTTVSAYRALTTYTAGQCFDFVTDTSNPVNVNIDGLGSKSLTLGDGASPPLAGTVQAHYPFTACYDGTVFRLKTSAATLPNTALPLGQSLVGNGSVGLTSVSASVYASVQSGSDACAKITAAIAIKLAGGGGRVDADFTGLQTCAAGFTVPPTINLFVGPAQFTINATPAVIVNEYAWLVGSGGSSANSQTLFSLGNGLNGDVIQAVASAGPSAFWHQGKINDLAINGNNANNTAGNGLHIYQIAEDAEIDRVRVFNAAGDGYRLEGSLAGTWTMQGDSSFSNNGCGFNFYNVSSTAKMISDGGDNNVGGGYCVLPGPGGIFSLAIMDGKLETGARGTDPAILIDGTNSPTLLTVVNLLTNTTGTNFIEVVNNSPSTAPSVTVIGSKISYTNLYNDTGDGYVIPFASVANGSALNFWSSGSYGSAAFQSIAFPNLGLTPANGTNENVCLGPAGSSYAGFARITGPTAAFNIGGLTCQGSASDGRLLILENTTSQAMTINNQDSGSAAGNRISTQTGANVALPAGPSGAVFLYDKTSTSWLMVSAWPLAASAMTDTTNASNISSGTLAAARVATLNQNTTGNAATASALAATPTQAASGHYCTGVTAAGNCNSAQVLASQVSGLPTFPTGAIVGTTDTQTLTNKSISLSEISAGSAATGTFNFSGSTAVPLPSAGGAAPTAGADFRFDSNQQANMVGGNGSLTGSLPRLIYWAHPTSDIVCAHGGDTTISTFSYSATACDNTAGTDAVSTAVTFSSQASIPSGFMLKDKMLRAVWQLGEWSNTTTSPALTFKSLWGPTAIYSSSSISDSASLANRAVTVGCLIIADGAVGASATMSSDCTVSVAGATFGTDGNTIAPLAAVTNSTESVSLALLWVASGIKSGTYTSGITATGTTGQTCALTAFNNGNSAGTATVALTGTNTIAAGTALVITNTGYASSSAATSATAGNGTGTCSGTATVSTVLGGAQGNALQLRSVTLEELN